MMCRSSRSRPIFRSSIAIVHAHPHPDLNSRGHSYLIPDPISACARLSRWCHAAPDSARCNAARAPSRGRCGMRTVG
eukprot:5994872-Alexandrium_andersonii.AAC.1